MYPTAPAGGPGGMSSPYPAGGPGFYPPGPGGTYPQQGGYYPGQAPQPFAHPGAGSPYPPAGAAGSPYPPSSAGGPYPPPGSAGGPYPPPGSAGGPYPPPSSAGGPYPPGGAAGYPPPPGQFGDPSAPGSAPPSATGPYGVPPGTAPGSISQMGQYPPPGMAPGSYPPPPGSVPLPQVRAPSVGPPNTSVPSAMVELTVCAKNLLDRDTFSKSDPVCVLYIKEFNSNEWVEVGRTEQIKNNLNPSWNKKFILEYRFEERQMLKFAIYDWDGSSYSLNAHDFLGSLECSLGEVVAAPGKRFERNLVLPPQFGGKTSQMVVIAEELGSSKEVIHIKLNGRKLDKKDFLGKSDPYIVISKLMDDGSWVNVHKTEVIKNTLNPDWRAFSVRVASLTGGNPEKKLRFECFDWDSDGSSDFIGEFDITYADLLSAAKENRAFYPLINPAKKAKKKSYSSSGTLNVEWLRIEEEKTFLDYIQSGVQLHFTVAIDFTASNGDPSHPQSLHYRQPGFDNQYSLAIKAVGEIIQDYDSDKLFPAMGFGAKVPPGRVVSHEFFLNGNAENPFCQGVQGILDAYHQSLNSVTLYGPTYFAPIINHVARFAASYQDGKNYFVLLIITDGIICDMDATKEAIINASHLPMSIIIVGVGQEDFSAMEFLDSDGHLLRHNGKAAVRDIVQFVELQKFVAHYGQNQQQTQRGLAKEVLAEIPGQVCAQLNQAIAGLGSTSRTVLNTAI